MGKEIKIHDTIDLFLYHLDNKTKIKIIKCLLSGTKSFDELAKYTKCFPWSLWFFLKDLTKKKIITTAIYPAIPIRIEYTLTGFGESFKPAINSMVEWSYSYKTHRIE
ncbi:helix-turn-helix transcriptional regulator [bacterium]|nr:helix-turn-helix transcriptional regulator [bacterium]